MREERRVVTVLFADLVGSTALGETLDPVVMDAATGAIEAADVVLVVGTSSIVYPVAELPRLARRRNAHVVEINMANTPLSPAAHEVLRGAAGEVLPALVDAL